MSLFLPVFLFPLTKTKEGLPETWMEETLCEAAIWDMPTRRERRELHGKACFLSL
jgi:hypothetical protein